MSISDDWDDEIEWLEDDIGCDEDNLEGYNPEDDIDSDGIKVEDDVIIEDGITLVDLTTIDGELIGEEYPEPNP